MDQNANMMIIRIMSFKTIAANLIQGLSKVEQVLNPQTFLPTSYTNRTRGCRKIATCTVKSYKKAGRKK
jgi:hypothetical protein